MCKILLVACGARRPEQTLNILKSNGGLLRNSMTIGEDFNLLRTAVYSCI